MSRAALEQEKGGVLINLKVIPNSDSFGIRGENQWRKQIRVAVSSAAREGKANRELLDELESVLRREIEIVSGSRSREKRLIVKGATVEEVSEKLGWSIE